MFHQSGKPANNLLAKEMREVTRTEEVKLHRRICMRRTQMKILENGNATMAIWLGKQMLGQRDMITTEHVGSGGGAIQLSVKPDLSKLTDEELEQLLDIAGKTAPALK